MNGDSEDWVERLHDGHPRREQAVTELHELLLRAAFHALPRSSLSGGLS
jgi:hypothetical protein